MPNANSFSCWKTKTLVLWKQVRKGMVKDLNRALTNHGMKMHVASLVRALLINFANVKFSGVCLSTSEAIADSKH